MKSYSKTIPIPIISSVVSVGVLFIVSVGAVVMPLPTYLSPLTPEEEEYLNRNVALRRISEKDFPMIIRRMRRDPQREGALKRVINNDFNARLSRDIHDISRAVRDPLIVWDTTKQYFEREGIPKGLGKIGLSMIASPFRVTEDLTSRRPIEYPLRTPVVALAWGVLISVSLAACLADFRKTFSHPRLAPVILPSPKFLWKFTLDRIRELSKAIQGKG